MLITRERDKLINAVLYFAANTEYCGKVKLFKLLYFLDFEHFKITGRSVTGLDYYAWKMGPVPTQLFDEIQAPEHDMASAVEFDEIPVYQGNASMLKINAKVSFNSKNFTKRELKLMQSLASEYSNKKADDMIEATHLENMPWDKVYNKDNKKRDLIPYELSLRSQEAEIVNQVVVERKQAIASLS
ncbi:Panacea domain-containing protein [Arsukibacterium perlucidum]|uniref:Panacea domain-containing protein n=1 Tax=Arsukibacterium perlucidum TaxID=368811 RepID=UPI000369C859|nr:Panacea domain-containing protein [Arsukibacterium perlucidum]